MSQSDYDLFGAVVFGCLLFVCSAGMAWYLVQSKFVTAMIWIPAIGFNFVAYRRFLKDFTNNSMKEGDSN